MLAVSLVFFLWGRGKKGEKRGGGRKSTVRCEKPFRSFSPSSIHVSFLTFHRNHSPFAVSPHLRYRPRFDARNSLEFFVSLLPFPFFFFLSLFQPSISNYFVSMPLPPGTMRAVVNRAGYSLGSLKFGRDFDLLRS